MSEVKKLIAEARRESQWTDMASSTAEMLNDLADALEASTPSSDDTEWQYQCKAPGEEWRDCVAPGCRNPRRKRVPAGPWVAIEKGGESA